jgi:hypothetical protein
MMIPVNGTGRIKRGGGVVYKADGRLRIRRKR